LQGNDLLLGQSQLMIIFNWPPKELNPNSRGHFYQLAKVKKKYRKDCFYIAKSSGITPPKTESKPHLYIIFQPPDLRRRDLDNCLASIKAGLDGLADAWGVDDHNFKLTIEMDTENTNGKVLIGFKPDGTDRMGIK